MCFYISPFAHSDREKRDSIRFFFATTSLLLFLSYNYNCAGTIRANRLEKACNLKKINSMEKMQTTTATSDGQTFTMTQWKVTFSFYAENPIFLKNTDFIKHISGFSSHTHTHTLKLMHTRSWSQLNYTCVGRYQFSCLRHFYVKITKFFSLYNGEMGQTTKDDKE